MELSKQKVTARMSHEEVCIVFAHHSMNRTVDAIRSALVTQGWNRSLANIRALFLRPQIRELWRIDAEEQPTQQELAEAQGWDHEDYCSEEDEDYCSEEDDDWRRAHDSELDCTGS